MSRIGKLPISVPPGVNVRLDPASRTIHIEGPKGKLSFCHHPEVFVAWNQQENSIVCTIDEREMANKQVRALWGTTRASIANMIVGVTKGYTRKLEVIGVGWTARAAGPKLQLTVGYCNPITMTPPPGVQFTAENNVITVSGPDKAAVGEFAAEIRVQRLPEPYNGKGIKYEGEVITRKQGKVFGA